MSEIEDLVLGELRKQSELKPIERGFVWERGEDVSRLWFQPTTVPANQFGLCAIAFIETIFGPASRVLGRAFGAVEPAGLFRELRFGERPARDQSVLLHL